MLANTDRSYGLVAQILHWLTAALILLLIVLGVLMGELPADSSAQVATKFFLYSLHKTVGIAAFLVALVRVVWAIAQPNPHPLNSDKPLESLVAQTIHWTLYAAILIMPLSGWMHHAATDGLAPIWWPFSQDLPYVPNDPQLADILALVHTAIAILIGGALLLHVAGAVKHGVIDRDDTLRRMTPGFRYAPPAEIKTPKYKRAPALLSLTILFVVAALVYAYARFHSTDVGIAKIENGSIQPNWIVDPTKSRLGIAVVVQGSRVDGDFEDWHADIRFDPDRLEEAKVDVQIDIGSLSLGNLSEQALAPAYLNVDVHPMSSFISDTFIRTGERTYEARGWLTLAGQHMGLVLPFELMIAENQAIAKGKATVNRLDFGIGPAQRLVELSVDIFIDISANRVGSPRPQRR